MIILGIDTSCDDTSAGIVLDGTEILANVIHSQVAVHHPHGGVVPELASREHVRNIVPVVEEALKHAGLKMAALDGIAVTVGPGLVGALLVGLYYAKGLAYVLDKPLMAVNHLEGHILSIFLEGEPPTFPFVALTVSGGHTSLYHVEDFGRYSLLGQTLDDAAGEAFDKVAKISGMGYPGGVAIEKAAVKGRHDAVVFPRAYMSKSSLDFSFSGLKTAVSLFLKKWREDPSLSAEISLFDIVASFQEAVVDVLVDKAMVAGKTDGGGFGGFGRRRGVQQSLENPFGGSCEPGRHAGLFSASRLLHGQWGHDRFGGLPQAFEKQNRPYGGGCTGQVSDSGPDERMIDGVRKTIFFLNLYSAGTWRR